MKHLATFFVFAGLATLVPLAQAVEPNSLTAAEKAGGWRLLFDGRTLTGWRSMKTDTPGAGWKAVEGVLATPGKAGDIVTTEEFGDFELSAEWKVEEGTNSGIIYRVGLGEDATYRTGPEYQVLDNVKAHDNQIASHLAGSLYDLVAPVKDATKPVGEWNEARIVVRGWRVEHWLNGVKLLELDLASAAGKTLIAASKFSTMPKFATLSRGHLALQDHGDPVSYRSIKIRELK
jgi:Domain of Unknown Function (DUF1080)